MIGNLPYIRIICHAKNGGWEDLRQILNSDQLDSLFSILKQVSLWDVISYHIWNYRVCGLCPKSASIFQREIVYSIFLNIYRWGVPEIFMTTKYFNMIFLYEVWSVKTLSHCLVTKTSCDEIGKKL